MIKILWGAGVVDGMGVTVMRWVVVEWLFLLKNLSKNNLKGGRIKEEIVRRGRES